MLDAARPGDAEMAADYTVVAARGPEGVFRVRAFVGAPDGTLAYHGAQVALREAAYAEWASHAGVEPPAPHEYEVGIAPAPLIHAEARPVVLPARPSERAEALLAGCWAPEIQGEVVARIHWPAGGGLKAAIVAAGSPGADEVGLCAGFDVAAPLHAETPPWGYELHPCGPGPIPDGRMALLEASGWRYSSRAWVFASPGAAFRV